MENEQDQQMLEEFLNAFTGSESPFQADPGAPLSQPVENVFGEGAPQAPAPIGGYSANPYQIPDLRSDRAGTLMENALSQFGSYAGGDYYRSGGQEWGRPTEDSQGRSQSAFGAMSQLSPDRAIDYSKTGVDTSGNNPVLRVLNMNGEQMVAKPIRDFNDYSSIPSPFSPMLDANGDRMLDENGRQRYNDLPGFDYRRVAGAGLNPTTLENGQQVYYDRFNNLTYGARDGGPGQMLAGGLGLDGATRQQANYYGWNPTQDRFGRPVYYDEAGNRTFVRNPDGSAGRQILDVNGRTPTFLNGQGAGPAPVQQGRGSGGGGGPQWDGVYRNLGNPTAPFQPSTNPEGGSVGTHSYGDYTLIERTPGKFDIYDRSGQLIESNVPQARIQPNTTPTAPTTPAAPVTTQPTNSGNGQRVSPAIPVTNAAEQNALGIPSGSTKQKFDTGDGTPAIYRYTAPNGDVVITDAEGNILQRSPSAAPAKPQPAYQPDNSQYFTAPSWRPEDDQPRYNRDYVVK